MAIKNISNDPDTEPFPIYLISQVLFGLSMISDEEKYDHITINEVKYHAKRGDLIPFLKASAGGYFASNNLDQFPKFTFWYTDQIAALCHTMDGRERRKYGIENRGISLLISYTAEILQSNHVPLQFMSYDNP